MRPTFYHSGLTQRTSMTHFLCEGPSVSAHLGTVYRWVFDDSRAKWTSVKVPVSDVSHEVLTAFVKVFSNERLAAGLRNWFKNRGMQSELKRVELVEIRLHQRMRNLRNLCRLCVLPDSWQQTSPRDEEESRRLLEVLEAPPMPRRRYSI